jgi:murein DD-endopeptidase MepM/ murein hydrolase activator NlpD
MEELFIEKKILNAELFNLVHMLLCPLQNQATLKQNWIQVRPTITQQFGLNPAMYAKFSMQGHNGVDYRAPMGTPIYAPMDGVVKVINSVGSGYGLHIRIRNDFKDLECVLGHLSNVLVTDGQRVNIGQKIAESGNSGFSTGPHLHEGYRKIIPNTGDVWTWKVADYDNGFFGYFDHLEFVITWKGGFLKNSFQ